MILYLTIIIVSSLAIILTNACFVLPFGTTNLHFFLCLGCLIIVDAVVAAVVHAIPEEKIDPFKFKVGEKEIKFLDKLRIKKWKDLVPETGKYLAHFAKDKVAKPNDNVYLLKFLRETVYAEVMHFISLFLGFLPIIFLPSKLNICLPEMIVNAFLQLLPAIIQRYNRFRITKIYRHNEKMEKKHEAK